MIKVTITCNRCGQNENIPEARQVEVVKLGREGESQLCSICSGLFQEELTRLDNEHKAKAIKVRQIFGIKGIQIL